MSRVDRDFFQRDSAERAWMVENTWCGGCSLPDLGIDDPSEFEEDGLIFIEGRCRICGRAFCPRKRDACAHDV